MKEAPKLSSWIQRLASCTKVRDHASVKDDVGYYLELTGVLDEKAKAISVRSVKRLGDVVQMCARPVRK